MICITNVIRFCFLRIQSNKRSQWWKAGTVHWVNFTISCKKFSKAILRINLYFSLKKKKKKNMKMQLKQKLDILLIAGNGPSLAALVNYCALLVIWSNSYFIPSTILFQGFPLNIFTKTFALFLNITNWHGIKFWNYHWARWMQLWKLQKKQFTNNHTKGLQGLHLALNNIRKKKKQLDVVLEWTY